MNFKLGVLLVISAQFYTTLALPPCVCASIFEPVCGSDGVEYRNQCRLECAIIETGRIITVAKLGRCEESQTPGPCEAILLPVCGTDGTTYSNECVLDAAKRNNPGLSVAHKGPCKA